MQRSISTLPQRQGDGAPVFIGFVDCREYLHHGAAIFPGNERRSSRTNGLKKILNLESVVMGDWVDGLEAGPVSRLKLRQQMLFARYGPKVVQRRLGYF